MLGGTYLLIAVKKDRVRSFIFTGYVTRSIMKGETVWERSEGWPMTGDVLDVALGDPSPTLSEEGADDFFVRRHPDSGDLGGFSLRNCATWFQEVRE